MGDKKLGARNRYWNKCRGRDYDDRHKCMRERAATDILSKRSMVSLVEFHSRMESKGLSVEMTGGTYNTEWKYDVLEDYVFKHLHYKKITRKKGIVWLVKIGLRTITI